MPLLRKEPFIREQPATDIKPNDYVFYCKITGEIFTDYEKFFARIILCNSLVWTCSYTGRQGLTFQEALDSEKKAKDLLAAFPAKLQRPVLCVAMQTQRARLDDMNQDVYVYAKDRYFIGEEVDAVVNNQKKSCTVIDVILPAGQKSANSDIDLTTYKYIVQEIGQPVVHTLESCKVGRRRGVFQRDRCKLFLKYYCHADASGIWRVKTKYIKQFKLYDAKFKDVCGGTMPNFPKSVAKKKPRVVADSDDDDNGLQPEDVAIQKAKEAARKRKHSEKSAEATDGHYAKKTRVDTEEALKMEEQARILAKERLKLDKEAAKLAKKNELKKKADEEKEKRKEEKAKVKEEKRRQEEYLREWNKIREDMECDDLKDLPKPEPIKCDIDGDAVGDAMSLLEFLTCFKPLFDFDLSSDLSFATLTKALASTELDGLFFDLLRQLLSAVFRLQEDEEATENDETDGKHLPEMAGNHNVMRGSCRELVRAATVASQWPILNFGTPLSQLPIESYTVSEIARIHLLGSGAERLQPTARFDYQQRGGYTAADDPALDFRRREAAVLKALGEHNVFDLPPGDKVKILCVLMNQLLTFATCRDYIDDCCEKLKQAQRDLRTHQYAEIRRERDEAQFWWRKKAEENARSEGRAAGEEGTVKDRNEELKSEEAEKESKKKNGRKKKGFPSDKEYESMPMENLDWEKISAEERQHMKDWAQRKEKALVDQASELQFSTSICPLGRDRTFRRYWVFRSTPGLFVEDNEQYIGDDFLQPVEQKLPAKHGTECCSAKSSSSNKENVLESSDRAVDCKDSMVETKPMNGDEAVVMTTTKSSSLSVHEQIAMRNSTRWSVFVSPGDVDRLIESLNPRGIREGMLRQIISDQRAQISECIARCSIVTLCDKSSKSLEMPRGADVASHVAERRLEDVLRESLLDLEDRICTGNLGMLKVLSRDSWRAAINASGYDPQCSTLSWGGGQTMAAVIKPAELNGGVKLEETKCNGDTGVQSEMLKSTIGSLASALLQIEQMIDAKYVNPPLGDNEEVKKQKQKALIDDAFRITMKGRQDGKTSRGNKSDNEEESDDEAGSTVSTDADACSERQLSAVERWEKSLMSSMSLPQLWLHYSVLESSIAWSRSSLHARCRICRRKGDGERMLLCDACDRGHHMYCLKPPVKTIPQGNWFCPSCRPKEVVHAPRTPRKSFTDKDIFDDEADGVSIDEKIDDMLDSVSQEPIDHSIVTTEAEQDDEDNESQSATETECDTADDMDESYVPSETAKVKIPQATSRRRGAAAALSRSSTPLMDLESRRSGQGSSSSSRRPCRQKPAHLETAVVVNSASGSASRSTTRTRPRNVEMNSHGVTTPFGTGLETGMRRKAAPGWVDYEVDSKRLSLVTKSRFSDAENSLKSCEDLVTELMRQEDSWPFLKPVTKKEAADYFDVIKNPMDFARIRNKINRFEYNSASEILDDIRLIFSNCAMYNLPMSIVAVAGSNLEKYFEQRIWQLNLVKDKPTSVTDDFLSRGGRTGRKRTTL